MAYSEGQLNGGADYRVGFNIVYSGVQNATQSRFDWAVYLQNPTAYGSWTNATSHWYTSIGGVAYSGTFVWGSGNAYVTSAVVGSGSTWINHDAAGHRPGFPSDAYIIVPHGNIGEGGSGQAWVDAPRIAQVPAAPTPLGLDQITASAMRYMFQGNDNGGSAILEWQFQYDDDPAFGSPVTVSSGGTSTVTGLLPSKRYYFRSRGRNGVGWGAWSAVIDAKTLAALFFLDPDNPGAPPEPVTLYAWTGAAYELVDLLIDPELDGTFTYPAA